jgi:hypothetical protein
MLCAVVEAARQQPVVPALVQREPRPNGAGQRADSGYDLLRPGHLRNASRVDEARELYGRQTRRSKPADQLDTHVDIEDLGLVLEPVARPDVVDGDA